jgi:hypothetical protein
VSIAGVTIVSVFPIAAFVIVLRAWPAQGAAGQSAAQYDAPLDEGRLLPNGGRAA